MRTKEELKEEILNYLYDLQPYEPTVEEIAEHCQMKPIRMFNILKMLENDGDVVNFV